METQTLRDAIRSSALFAREWFFERAIEKEPKDWKARNALGDDGTGAVYAFFGAPNQCLYVGQSTLSLKQRARHPTSRHYDTKWWPHWKRLRFVNISHQTEQLVLEGLLILVLAPCYNSKQAAIPFDKMFASFPN